MTTTEQLTIGYVKQSDVLGVKAYFAECSRCGRVCPQAHDRESTAARHMTEHLETAHDAEHVVRATA